MVERWIAYKRSMKSALVRLWLELRYAYPHRLELTGLAASPGGKLRIAVAASLLTVKWMLPRGLRQRPVRMDFDEWGTVWVTDRSECRVACEIFVSEIYESPVLPRVANTILDLGANVGLAAVYFAYRYPNAQIVSYEPDPIVAARAHLNIRRLPQVELRVAAVGARAGEMTLFRAKKDSWITGEFADGEPFITPAVRLHALLEEFDDVDVLKIDIEGSEHEALADCKNLSAAKLILGELHTVPGHSTARFLAALEQFELAESEIRDGCGTFVAVARPLAPAASAGRAQDQEGS